MSADLLKATFFICRVGVISWSIIVVHNDQSEIKSSQCIIYRFVARDIVKHVDNI